MHLGKPASSFLTAGVCERGSSAEPYGKLPISSRCHADTDSTMRYYVEERFAAVSLIHGLDSRGRRFASRNPLANTTTAPAIGN